MQKEFQTNQSYRVKVSLKKSNQAMVRAGKMGKVIGS